MLENPARRRLIVSGRQVGKTQMLGVYAIWWGLLRPNHTILIVAPTLRQSKIMYDRVREMIERNTFVASHCIHNTISYIEFDNHTKIYCLPAGMTGENIRGYPSDLVICDEAPIIKDRVFQAITPGLSARKGTLILSGTPWGQSGYFWRVFTTDEHDDDYKFMKYRIMTAENPLTDEKFLASERRRMTDAEYRMEYEAEFIPELDEYYPRHLLKECLDDYGYEESAVRRDIVIGVDPARFGSDETALVMLERLSDASLEAVPKGMSLYKVIAIMTEQVTTIPEIARMVKEAINQYHPKRVVVDETGLGGGVVDILTEDIGGDMVEGFGFTGVTRKRMYDILKIAIERVNLVLSADDEKFIRQFSGYKLKKSRSLDGRLIVSKDILGHDDLVDALALALYGFEGGGSIGVMEDWADGPKVEEANERPRTKLSEELDRIRVEQQMDEEVVAEAEFWGL